MASFIRIGESLINLEWVRAVEYAGDGRLNVYVSEDRAAGLVLRYSGEEGRRAWETLSRSGGVPIINPEPDDAGGNVGPGAM